MKADIEASTYSLGLAICFILVAFISYSLGSNNKSLALSPPQYSTRVQAQTHPENEALSSSKEQISDLNYERGFKDGIATFFKLDVHDMTKEARQGAKGLVEEEQRLKMRLEEMEKKEDARQKMFEANMRDMKKWREEQLRSIWDQKQAGERNIMSWFRKDLVPDRVRGTEVIEWRGDEKKRWMLD
jgi:hypothetical protein